MSVRSWSWKGWLRLALAVLATAACVAIVGYGMMGKVAPVSAGPIGARLELATGEVKVDQGAGEQLAVSGTALLAEAKVKTGKGSRALVKLPDGSSLFLRGDSAIKLGAGTVTLESGEYWLSAPPVEREGLVHRVGEAGEGG